MAVTFKLSDAARLVTYDLSGGTLHLAHGGWEPGVAGEDGFAMESILLVGTDTDTNLITAEAAIDAFRTRIDEWFDNRLKKNSVWLEANSANESVRRVLLHDLTLRQITSGGLSPLFALNGAHYSLVLERYPLWEEASTSLQVLSSANTYDSLGEVNTFAASKGTAHARIARIAFSGANAAISEVWCGIRETLEGTDNFVALAEIEWGTAGTDTALGSEATVVSPSGSSTDNKFVCTFSGDTTLVERAALTIKNIADNDPGGAHTDYDHYIGNYKVLLRCKVDGTAVCGVQLKWNYASAPGFVENAEVYDVDNTSYMLIDLGEVRIPPNAYRYDISGTSALVSGFELQFHAELISGSGSLHLDAIVLLPSDHLCHISEPTMDLTVTTGDIAYIFVHEDGEVTVMQIDAAGTTGPKGMPEFSVDNWRFPAYTSGIIVVAAQRASSQVLADTVNVALSGYHRWYNHRTS